MSHSEEPPAGQEPPEKVGYGKPPKKTQFKKGQSGNPKGRPKRKHFHAVLEDVLDEGVYMTVNGEKRYVSKLEAVIQQMVSKCIQGNPEAMKLLIHILKHYGGIHPI